MPQETTSAADQFELGKLYADKGEFRTGIVKIEKAARDFYDQRNFNRFLECQNLLLRMYAEQENFSAITESKERLQDLVLKEGFELNSKTYYTLGVCSSYKKQFELALDYFQKALTIALAADDKVDICYAIIGLAATYNRLGRLQEALKEIYNLKIFFEVLDVPDLKISAKLVNTSILRKLKKYDGALEILWDCYDLLSQQKNMFMYLCLLYMMGLTYKESGDLNMARMYLQLAKRSIDPENLKVLSKQVESLLDELGVNFHDDYDLIFEQSTNSIKEKKKGLVDFKNQFILLDLLRLFIQKPGHVYSKEALVQNIWKQDYDPAVHDNKIYVTIKRLRKLIEPEYEKPKYIFRGKSGYYLNKGTKVLIEQ